MNFITNYADASYHSFLRSRWVARASLLGKYAIGGSFVLLLFDWILTRYLPISPSFAMIALVRLTWVVMPLTGMLAARFAPEAKWLPAMIVSVSVLWCWGNEWAYFHLGLAGTSMQVITVIAACVTAGTFLPLNLAGIVFVCGSIVAAHVAMDITWPQASPLGLRLTVDAGLLIFVIVEIVLFRNFTTNRRRGLALRADLERALSDLEASRRVSEADLQMQIQLAVQEVRVLSGLLPICAACKKIRDDAGIWHLLESYVQDHTEANFSHGICPECAPIYFPKRGNPNKRATRDQVDG